MRGTCRVTGPCAVRTGRRPERVLAVVAVASLLTAVPACGGAGNAPATSTTTTSTTTPATTSGTDATGTPGRLTAASQLAGFFTTAARADRQERSAAALVSAGVGTGTIVLSPATVAAVRAIDTGSVARALPGGVPPTLLVPLLQVYEDLTTRRAAFNRVLEYAGHSPLPRGGTEAKEFLDCLGHGAAPARWYGSDLTAARAAAERTARLTLPAADSRAAAETAIRAALLRSPNFCSAECGGFYTRSIPLYPISWKHTVLAPGSTWDGTVGRQLFVAHHTAGSGWDIGFNAC